MRKTHAKARFIMLAILSAILLVLTIFGFPIPGTDDDFVGFARAIESGIDYKGGTVYNYSINKLDNEDINLDNAKNAFSTLIKNTLNGYYYNCNTYFNGDYLCVELVKEYEPMNITEIINIKPTFSIKSENSEDAEALISSSDVTNAYASTISGTVGLYIEFNNNGSIALSTLTSSGNGTAYFFIGSQTMPVTFNQAVTENYVFLSITGSDAFTTAEGYAATILSSKYNVSFEEVSKNVITENIASRNVIISVVLIICLFLAITLTFILIFKKLGLVASFILLIAGLLQILLYSSFPTVVLTTPALCAAILAFLVGSVCEYIILSKMHSEYKTGKKLYASVDFGFRKIWLIITDIFLMFAIPSLVGYFFGTYLVKSFALALVLGIVVYGLTTLLLTKLFTKWLINITVKPVDYGFKREDNVDELA